MLPQKYSKRSFYISGLLFVLIAVNGQLPLGSRQSQTTQWSYPQPIPGYDPETWSPILVADQNRTVHAFSSQWIREEGSKPIRAIFYNRWTLAQGWTTPTDILLSPYEEARLTDAHLDRNGIIHVVFFGGDNLVANIYYSRAPAAISDDARAWSVPVIVGANAADPEGAAITEDDQGHLHIIYNGKQLGRGLYQVGSSDMGETWSEPFPIFFTTTDNPNIAQLCVIKAKSGSYHVIWGVYTLNGQGRGIYYARSDDGNEWSEPILLAAAQEGLGTTSPTIYEYEDTLLAFYHQAIVINMRRSSDDGKTWDVPSPIFTRHVGGSGAPSLVVDANNDLHLFVGQRISGSTTIPDIHGMWHSLYLNNRWLEPDAIIKGPQVVDEINDKGFDPSAVQAIVSQGNVILVTWITDPGIGPNGVWYSYKQVNAPERPVMELPALANSSHNPSIVDTSLVEGAVSITPNATDIQIPTDKPIFPDSPSLPIFLGSLSVIVVIFVVIVHKNISK